MELKNSSDKVFLERVRQDIEDNIGNENYSVESLAEAVGLSRSMLHRKLVKIKGVTASDMIMDARLSCAKKMLEQDQATVAEIAYKVGFNSPSYFNKVYKKYFNISPGEVRKTGAAQLGNELIEQEQKKTLSQASRISYSILGVVLIVITMAFVSYAAYLLWGDKEGREMSVAVLPLNNMTGIEDSDYFVDGMHDALIGELGKISSIRVISRTSTLRYRNSKKYLKVIAKELGVDCIVEGSVVCLGDSLCILIQVIEVFPEERHLLVNQYNDLMPNALIVQSAMAHDIVANINVGLSNNEKEILSAYRPVHPETYKSYLRGMYYLNQGTKESFEKGIQQLRLAIDNDPGDPFAYAGMALGYAIMGHGQLKSEEAFLMAVASAEKAIKLDPDIQEAHCALSILHLYKSWDWALAKDAFENTLRTNPNNAIAHAHFAWYYILFDNKEKSLHHAYKATLLEPFSASYHSWLGLLYLYFGEYDKAEESARKALELQENIPYGNFAMSRLYLRKNKFKEAIAYSEKLPKGLSWDVERGYTYIKAGQKEKAMELWHKLEEEARNNNINPCLHGEMAAYMGFSNRAFELLNEAIEQKSYPITYLVFYSYTEDLMHDPRYADLMRKMNLPYKKYLITQN